MTIEVLRERILALAEGFTGLGIGPEVYAFTLAELEGLWAFLRRIAETHGGRQ
jgi:hypothetical protein